jgi:hypothetical protein
MRARWPIALNLTGGRAQRNVEFGELQETFLVSAVTTILVIRTQLWLTNYPQLGGHGLHIAHLLWGGMFMAIAIGILVTFLGRAPRRTAAIVGGVGFGFFVDELGKFITADNDYFFKPAAALIYLIFVGLFLFTRAMQRQPGLTSAERLANAIELVGEAARRRFDARDRQRALVLLDGADPGDPLVASIRRIVDGLDAPAPRPSSRVVRWADDLRASCLRLVQRGWFGAAVGWIFAAWAVLSALAVFELVLPLGFHLGGAMPGYRSDAVGDLSVVNVASLVSSLVSVALVALGVQRLRTRDRLDAYRALERAVLVSVFVTRVFAFVDSQFAAVFGLAVDLLLLIIVRTMASQDRRSGEPSVAPGDAAPVQSGVTGLVPH